LALKEEIKNPLGRNLKSTGHKLEIHWAEITKSADSNLVGEEMKV